MHNDNKNLSTISETASESFFKLALLDTQENLYSMMKHYNEIQSAYGTVSMKIDDWSNAESERADLLREWEETYHMDIAQYIIL